MKYAVFIEGQAVAVLETDDRARALAAMDSLFEDSLTHIPDEVVVKEDGVAVETRRKGIFGNKFRLREQPKTEVHHHAAPYVPKPYDDGPYKKPKDKKRPVFHRAQL